MIREVLSERGRFAALDAEHPGVVGKEVCPGCGEILKAGDRVALVNPEPVEDERFIVTAKMAHEKCAFPNEKPLTSPEAFQNEVGSGS